MSNIYGAKGAPKPIASGQVKLADFWKATAYGDEQLKLKCDGQGLPLKIAAAKKSFFSNKSDLERKEQDVSISFLLRDLLFQDFGEKGVHAWAKVTYGSDKITGNNIALIKAKLDKDQV